MKVVNKGTFPHGGNLIPPMHGSQTNEESARERSESCESENSRSETIELDDAFRFLESPNLEIRRATASTLLELSGCPEVLNRMLISAQARSTLCMRLVDSNLVVAATAGLILVNISAEVQGLEVLVQDVNLWGPLRSAVKRLAFESKTKRGCARTERGTCNSSGFCSSGTGSLPVASKVLVKLICNLAKSPVGRKRIQEPLDRGTGNAIVPESESVASVLHSVLDKWPDDFAGLIKPTLSRLNQKK